MRRAWVREDLNTYEVESHFKTGTLTHSVPGKDEAEAMRRAHAEYPTALHEVTRKTEDVGYIPLTPEEEQEADERERREYELSILRKALEIAEPFDVPTALKQREKNEPTET